MKDADCREPEEGWSIRRAAEACLLVCYGYDFKTSQDGGEIRFECKTAFGTTLYSQFVIHDVERVLRLYVHLWRDYPKPKKRWVEKLVSFLNLEVAVFGFFAMGENGSVFFQSAIDFANIPIDPSAVKEMMNKAAFPITVFEKAFARIDTPEVGPIDAVLAALVETDAYRWDDVSTSTRKALLKVVK